MDFNPFNLEMSVVWALYVHGLTHWEINPPAQLVDFMPATADRRGWALVALRPVRFDVVRLGSLPELFTTWFETMLDGTMARLYAMPAKPWSTPQLAQYPARGSARAWRGRATSRNVYTPTNNRLAGRSRISPWAGENNKCWWNASTRRPPTSPASSRT